MSSATEALVDVRGLSLEDAALLLETLHGQVDRIAARCDGALRPALAERFPDALAAAWEVPVDGHVLVVVAAPVAFGPDAVSRLVRRAAAPGRVVTRVFVPEADESRTVTLWSTGWLTEQRLDGDCVLDLGLAFDSAHLPHDHPQVRAWVPADEVGIVLASDVEADPEAWMRSQQVLARRQSRWSGVRARLGAVRRQVRLLRQRRAHRRRTAQGAGVRAP